MDEDDLCPSPGPRTMHAHRHGDLYPAGPVRRQAVLVCRRPEGDIVLSLPAGERWPRIVNLKAARLGRQELIDAPRDTTKPMLLREIGEDIGCRWLRPGEVVHHLSGRDRSPALGLEPADNLSLTNSKCSCRSLIHVATNDS